MASGLMFRQISREKKLMGRQKQAFAQAFLFFLMFVSFFPLVLPFDLKMLHTMCPGIVWMAMLMAVFLASERFYQTDIQYGYLEQWLVHRVSLQTYVLSKWLMHGFVNLLGMLGCVPIVALMYQLNITEMLSLGLSFLCGLPALLAMCGLVGAFGAYGPNRSILMLLVLFPLIIPIIMLGSATLTAAFEHFSILPYLALLSALSLGMVFILSFASAAILKISMENA
jgi:heme exporter protein B